MAPTVANVMFTNALIMLTLAYAGTANVAYHTSIELGKLGNTPLTLQARLKNVNLKVLEKMMRVTCQAQRKIVMRSIATTWTQMDWKKF